MARDRYGIKFDAALTRKLKETARYIDQQPRNRVQSASVPANFGGGFMLHVTTACNPMTGATPGINGKGKLQVFNGTTYSDYSTETFKIVNDTEKTVAIGAYVLCIPGPGGCFHLVTVDKCSNLS